MKCPVCGGNKWNKIMVRNCSICGKDHPAQKCVNCGYLSEPDEELMK